MANWPLAISLCVIKRFHENNYMWDQKNCNYKLHDHKKCFYRDLKNELLNYFPYFPVTEGKTLFFGKFRIVKVIFLFQMILSINFNHSK